MNIKTPEAKVKINVDWLIDRYLKTKLETEWKDCLALSVYGSYWGGKFANANFTGRRVLYRPQN